MTRLRLLLLLVHPGPSGGCGRPATMGRPAVGCGRPSGRRTASARRPPSTASAARDDESFVSFMTERFLVDAARGHFIVCSVSVSVFFLFVFLLLHAPLHLLLIVIYDVFSVDF